MNKKPETEGYRRNRTKLQATHTHKGQKLKTYTKINTQHANHRLLNTCKTVTATNNMNTKWKNP